MKVIAIILNFPASFLTMIAGILSLPYKIKFNHQPFAVIVYVRSFWWKGSSGMRGTTGGNVILLGKNLEKGDLEHELIHIQQAMREPLIHPFLYIYQSLRYGYFHNKYEDEAYRKAGNPYILPNGQKRYVK